MGLCDKIFNIKLKTKHLRNLTHNKIIEWVWIKQTIQNPNFFDIVSIVQNYVENQKKIPIIDIFLYFFISFNNQLSRQSKSESKNIFLFI